MRPGAAALLALVACGPPRQAAPLILVATLDTTRADALGAYADVDAWGADLPAARRPRPHTPRLDAWAAAGVRFQWALSHAPTTLSAHSSLWLGEDPHGHAVVRNGYPPRPGLPALPAAFSAAGWDTVAVIGASVLAADQGLAAGFRVYDDTLPTRVRRRYEAPAEDVVRRALAAVDARPDRAAPLLLWVHFFDPHSPWARDPAALGVAAPAYTGPLDGGSPSLDTLIRETRDGAASTADRVQARALYLAEVAAVDAALATLEDGLRARGFGPDLLLVAVGDHGETLDEVPGRPYGHGIDVEPVNLHVPLILRGEGRFALPAARVVPAAVRLLDVPATLSARAGLAPTFGAGQDLSPLWSDTPPATWPGGFAEATKPDDRERTDAWNNLPFARAAWSGDTLRLHFPLLGSAPRTLRLAQGTPPVDHPAAAPLDAALAAWDAAAPPHRPDPRAPHTTEALRALGYIDAAP
jgi:arylsulfatase A-like enzyme